MRKRRKVAGREKGKRKAWKKKYLFLIVCENGVLVFKYCVT